MCVGDAKEKEKNMESMTVSVKMKLDEETWVDVVGRGTGETQDEALENAENDFSDNYRKLRKEHENK